jgi:hypothetical protein
MLPRFGTRRDRDVDPSRVTPTGHADADALRIVLRVDVTVPDDAGIDLLGNHKDKR